MDNPNQLDLSKFPKITSPAPAEEKLEVEKRSKGIIDIRELMENLLNLLQSYLTDLQQLDHKSSVLQQFEQNLKDREFELIQKEKKVYEEKEDIKHEREYINSQQVVLAKRELEILENKNLLEEINKAKDQAETMRLAALKQEEVSMEKLDAKEAQLLKESGSLRELKEELNNSYQELGEKLANLKVEQVKVETDKKKNEVEAKRLEDYSKILGV